MEMNFTWQFHHLAGCLIHIRSKIERHVNHFVLFEVFHINGLLSKNWIAFNEILSADDKDQLCDFGDACIYSKGMIHIRELLGFDIKLLFLMRWKRSHAESNVFGLFGKFMGEVKGHDIEDDAHVKESNLCI
ncbi:hypothetical protein TRFO_12846 [Tritrichomonas foetus]|uniref:Uncharacterized protein n=1 Tax=Tritrichomonas foetus TaxID=1144522 RepID=A0A1J4L0B4_9EUKA|nr:hypothetical protein TRFO_12846 [Tritrichomonas foetus]|eukprot:OHT16953.1 hypothetical protein TRFO_12846 [Tritrichomonas foetus]